jgi:beta-glucosidase
MFSSAKILLGIGLLLAAAGGCSRPEQTLCSKIVLGTHPAVTPEPRNLDWWQQRHQAILERMKQKNPEVIFIGDSITHGWERKGKAVWEAHYAQYDALNLGYGGDRTEHVLWRLQNGEIDGIRPKLAVLMIGTNNAAREQYSAEQIAEGIQAIVCLLRQKLPDTKILILAIFPRGSQEQSQDKTQDASYNPLWAKNDQVNRMISKLADGRKIFFLDINKAFLNEQGVLTRDVMPDLLHPEEKGYALWAEAMEPTLKRLLK